MKVTSELFTGVAIGLAISGAGFGVYLAEADRGGSAGSEKEPLYWVAPMDPDYRRDAPGKSPMGMDLVPVFSEGASSQPKGTVSIDPNVVNNLGVRTAEVTKGTWESSIRTVGYVSYNEDRLVHIHPRVSGWVETLFVKAAGNPVSQGQPLYELYSPELVNAQEEFLLARKRNNQTLIDAARERLRALQMSDSFIEKLSVTGKVSQSVTFRAGQSGVVDNLEIREGFYVQPGTTMMSIGVLDDVWVEAEVFERQAAEVTVGLPVVMSLDYLPDREWRGEVGYVYPTLDPQLRTVRVRLRFPNDDGLLKPNMFTQVVIHVLNAGEVLSVPREAVIRTGSHSRVVLSMGDGRYRSTVVKIGRVGGERIEILSGLEAGERVVTSAQFLIDSESSKTLDFQRMDHEGLDSATRRAGSIDHGDMNHG